MPVLVGQERVQLSVGQARLIYTQVLTQILREQQVLLGMEPLVPLAEIAEMLLVLGGKLLAVYTVVTGYALDALGRRLNPYLLKNQQTQG